jgi:predicted metalloprotease
VIAMLWDKSRRSDNVVQDSGGGGGMGFGGLKLGGGGIIAVIIISLLLGKNPLELLGLLSGGMQGGAPSEQTPVESNDPQVDFVRAIVGSTEDVWNTRFQGQGYQPPRLVLFQGQVQSACGSASAAMGPFYCPGDRQVYLDLSFFQEMDTRFHAQGDFARAYVIAHEVGHHLQNAMGVFEAVQQQRQRGAEMEGAEGLSVRQELQADCYAGVWANLAQKQLQWLEAGDIEEGMNAASAVGDDRLQQQSRGAVVPDSFTHGSSAQRVRWFKVGFEQGSLENCDTFRASRL